MSGGKSESAKQVLVRDRILQDGIIDLFICTLWLLKIFSAMFRILTLSEVTLSIRVNELFTNLLAREHGELPDFVGTMLFDGTCIQDVVELLIMRLGR